MLQIENHYYFSGEHFFSINGIKYAVRLSLPHAHGDLYDRSHVKKVILPLIGTVRHHDYPEIQRFPSPEIVKALQDLFGVALVSARLGTQYEVEWKGDRPILIDNSIETIFIPSMITNFSRFNFVRTGNLATLKTSASKT
jgi:hypothetical protein